jgi:hypothetical protein
MAHLSSPAMMISPENLKTSTSTPKSSHREFFEKLYGSLDQGTRTKLDSSSSSDDSINMKKSSEVDKSHLMQMSGSSDDELPAQVVPKSSPVRPFPSFAMADQLQQPPLMPTLPYFPPLHHQNFGGSASPSSIAAAGSVESALRFSDFPFPGGLAAFRKS